MSSIRQKLAAKKLYEIVWSMKGSKTNSIGRALRDAGYSKETSLKPKLVTESKGFRDEMARLMWNETVIKKLRQLLDSMKLNKFVFDYPVSEAEVKQIIESETKNKVMEIVKKRKKTVCRYWSPEEVAIAKALYLIYSHYGYYKSSKLKCNDLFKVVEVKYIEPKISSS